MPGRKWKASKIFRFSIIKAIERTAEEAVTADSQCST